MTKRKKLQHADKPLKLSAAERQAIRELKVFKSMLGKRMKENE